LKNPNRTLKVNAKDVERFSAEQLACNIATRGWLEPNYWQLGVEGNMRYMSQMGGWSILDYGLYYAKEPWPYLRLGYASSLSSWALMNTGTPQSNFGFWYPGKENDGAAGSAYVPQAFGSNWFGKQQPRGAWQYSGEIDLGFSAALRTAAVIVAEDPIFGRIVYGGALQRKPSFMEIIPTDGIGRRFHFIGRQRRLHLELERDGFAVGAPIVLGEDLSELRFEIENRDPQSQPHANHLQVSGFSGYQVLVNGKLVAELPSTSRDSTVALPLTGTGPERVALRRVLSTGRGRRASSGVSD
jgi:hypothetical protein